MNRTDSPNAAPAPPTATQTAATPTTSPPHILLIDNYDSFSHNLVHALAAAGAHVTVHRNDAITRQEIQDAAPNGIVLSPGPGHPANPRDFGICTDLITRPLPHPTPILGVCLGMQGMAQHTGGHVKSAPEIVHGRASTIHLEPHPLLKGTPNPLEVGRYHSLMVEPNTLPPEWTILGATPDGTPMAMVHATQPWIGLQFHPESILTPQGPIIIQNFVRSCTP